MFSRADRGIALGGDMDTDIIGLIVLAVTLVVVVILANRRSAKPFQ
jgi:hypothetical protein